MHRRRLLAFLAGLVVLAVLGVGLAVAHGNHATANAQVSADGVVVEEAVLSTDGYLVLRVDEGGDPGRVVGVRPLNRGRHVGVTVRADDSFWANASGNVTLWAVLHADAEAGDGGFDPAVDTMLTWLGGPAGQRFPVARGERSASVVTRGAGPLENGTVPVVAATLPRRGHLVVHATANGTLGRQLGSRSLSAGRHTGVRVPVNASALDERALLAVVVHTADGDGRFEPGADPAVRVAGEAVASRYERTPGGRDPIRVNTPPRSDGDVGTTAGTGTATTDPGSSGAGAGPGAAGVVLALAVVAVWLARRSGV